MGDPGSYNRKDGIQVDNYCFANFSPFVALLYILNTLIALVHFRIRRNEVAVKGTIIFDAYSTITLSPVNFQ